MDFDTLKIEINELSKSIEKIKEALGYENKLKEIKKLEEETLLPGFWDNKENSTKVVTKMKNIKNIIQKIDEIVRELSDAKGYFELAEELNDNLSFKESQNLVNKLKESTEKLNIETLLSGEYDFNNAIITIHPGAGGTESHDWALMLYRMYVKWASKSKFQIEVLDMQEGEEAGIKSVTFEIIGENAYGYMKGEMGVHRLVRISPFDAGGRRHTSFASLEVLPEITEDIEIDINPDDLRVDTYRASGAGGQHINKTSSAVRITHIPTNIVVACQSERSQIQNRETAMKMLKSKLFDLKEKEQKETINDLKGEQKDIAWGSQIRSYVFCPYTLVKDHRTNYETGNVQAVMDGDLNGFIDSYLKSVLK